MDQVVLSYHDSLLHRSDLELLNEGQWLNDRLIGFMYEYFEREVFKELASRGFALFVNPSTVQYLKLCSSLDEAKICFLEPLEMNNRDVIFFPLNNNNRVNVAGGSHWSLAVLLKSTRSLIHFDSTGSNESEARTFFNKFKTFFSLENFSTDTEFPKQSNSSDCGVFLLAATESIASQLSVVGNEKLNEFDFSVIDSKYIKNYRIKCKNIIESKK